MDTIQWIVVFLIVLLMVALVLPARYSAAPAHHLKKKLEEKAQVEKEATCEVIGPCKRPCRYTSLNAEKGKYDHRADIDSQFEIAKQDVPNDYPLNNIGCCPYGKPLSRDLPVADVPMCMAKSSKDMRLHS